MKGEVVSSWGLVGRGIKKGAAAGVVIYCWFSASMVSADVDIIVRTRDNGGYQPVLSEIFSIIDACRSPLCEGSGSCTAASFDGACVEGEKIKAEPLDGSWYYHSREICCQEPSTVLKIKRKKNAVTPRAGFMNPAVLDLSFEYRFWCDLGLEVAAVLAEGQDASQTPRQIWAVALNIHPAPRDRVDVYFGPLVGYLIYDDVMIAPTAADPRQDVAVDDDVALGVNIGASFPFKRRSYGLNLGLRYFKAPRSVAGDLFELDEHVIVASAGLTWRF